MSKSISRRKVLGTGVAMAGACALAGGALAAGSPKRVIIWFDGPGPQDLYPKGMNVTIAEGLKSLQGWEAVPVNYESPDQGLSAETLSKTNVLIWWSKWHQADVKDELAERIARRVKDEGMGLIVIHSGYAGKPFIRTMGTSCKWKAGAIDDSSVKVIVKDAQHPIARGIKDFVIAKSERYTEPFDVPAPQSVVFDGLFTCPDGSKEPSRQGLAWQIGKGRVFYFQPGHETYPNFLQAEVMQILRNAVEWAGA